MSTKRWLGSAAATYDLWTISLSGTVISQTYTMTMNSKTVTYTAGGADTVTIILAALVAAWNASVIPEFAELTALALPDGGPYTSATITGDVIGRPSTISVSTSGGATFSIAHTTTATGPNDFTNALNWSGGVAPANSDTLVFDNGSIPCKYNLSTALTGIVLIVDPGYSGSIGLPFINSDATVTYNEYRTTSLTLAGGTATINGPALKRCNLAFGANTATIRVLATGTRQQPDPYTPIVLITGGDGSSALDISKGDVGVAFYLGQTATFPAIHTSYLTNALTDVSLVCGAGCTLTTVTKNGGNLTVNSAVTTLTQGVSGGKVTVAAGAITTLNVQNGTAVYNSTGTLATANLSGKAILDFNQDTRAKTVTNPIVAIGSDVSVLDDLKVVNSGVLSVNFSESTTFKVSHGDSNTCTFT